MNKFEKLSEIMKRVIKKPQSVIALALPFLFGSTVFAAPQSIPYSSGTPSAVYCLSLPYYANGSQLMTTQSIQSISYDYDINSQFSNPLSTDVFGGSLYRQQLPFRYAYFNQNGDKKFPSSGDYNSGIYIYSKNYSNDTYAFGEFNFENYGFTDGDEILMCLNAYQDNDYEIDPSLTSVQYYANQGARNFENVLFGNYYVYDDTTKKVTALPSSSTVSPISPSSTTQGNNYCTFGAQCSFRASLSSPEDHGLLYFEIRDLDDTLISRDLVFSSSSPIPLEKDFNFVVPNSLNGLYKTRAIWINGGYTDYDNYVNTLNDPFGPSNSSLFEVSDTLNFYFSNTANPDENTIDNAYENASGSGGNGGDASASSIPTYEEVSLSLGLEFTKLQERGAFEPYDENDVLDLSKNHDVLTSFNNADGYIKSFSVSTQYPSCPSNHTVQDRISYESTIPPFTSTDGVIDFVAPYNFLGNPLGDDCYDIPDYTSRYKFNVVVSLRDIWDRDYYVYSPNYIWDPLQDPSVGIFGYSLPSYDVLFGDNDTLVDRFILKPLYVLLGTVLNLLSVLFNTISSLPPLDVINDSLVPLSGSSVAPPTSIGGITVGTLNQGVLNVTWDGGFPSSVKSVFGLVLRLAFLLFIIKRLVLPYLFRKKFI